MVEEQNTPNKRGVKAAVIAAAAAAALVLALAICAGVIFGLRAWQNSREEASRSGQEDRIDRSEEDREEKIKWEEEYIFPQSDTKRLRRTQLSKLSEEELLLAKYEILARHGRKFSTPEYAEYFEATHWYKPKDNFDEGDLSDLEQKNIELIDSFLKEGSGSAAAAALLAKLEEYPQSALQSGIPIDGACCWLENPAGGQNTVFWYDGSGMQGTYYEGLICAKWLDMDHNGEPELMTITLTESFEGSSARNLVLELWKYDGQQAAAAMEPLTLELLLPSGSGSGGSLYYVKDNSQDYFYIPYWSGDMFWNSESILIITQSGCESVTADYSEDPDTGMSYESYYIGQTEVSRADYENKKAAFPPQNGGELWLDSCIGLYDDDGNLLPIGQMLLDADPYGWGIYGALYLDGAREIAETKSYLAGLAG